MRRQHGVVTHAQLSALGFSAKAIKHRLANGRLHRVYRGVYDVGRRELTPEGRWMAAVLACGPGAALSHGSAASLWGIGPEWRLIEVSVRRRCRHRRNGLRVRSRPSLPRQDLTTQRRIPITSPARTILDQAATPISDSSLERLVNEADAAEDIDLDPTALRRYCDLRAGEPGSKRLRKLLDPETFRLSDSELERRFRPIALAAGLPQPLTKQWVDEFEVDFYWPELGLVVETDPSVTTAPPRSRPATSGATKPTPPLASPAPLHPLAGRLRTEVLPEDPRRDPAAAASPCRGRRLGVALRSRLGPRGPPPED